MREPSGWKRPMHTRTHIRGLICGSVAGVLATAWACAPAPASAASGFGQISGSGGCLMESASPASGACGEGKGLFHPEAIAVSPDGKNVYVVGGLTRPIISDSFGTLTILNRNPSTGEVTDSGCLSSDGTDGRDGASGLCTPTPSLLGADGVTVSPNGLTVFVTTRYSASVVAFARNPTTGALTRLGCLQATPHPNSPCTPANLFDGTEDPLVSANESALYAASASEGTISAFTPPPPSSSEQPSTTGSGSSGSSASGTSGTSGTSGSSSGTAGASSGSSAPGLDALFTTTAGPFLDNPCVAVNGYDGSCAVGVAMKGVAGLELSPEGNQLYAVATMSRAIDVFTPAGKEGLVQTGCLMSAPPPGLCSASTLLQSPTSLAISPDGRYVYVADQSDRGGRIDILSRNATTGQLADVNCVDYLPEPVKPEPGEESHEETHGEEPEEEQPAAKEPPDECKSVAGLESVSALAISGDGSALYAFGKTSAVSFARDPSSGALTETACASSTDTRCAVLSDLTEVEAATVSPDGQDVYVATAGKQALLAFGLGAAVTNATAAATHAGVALVRVACPPELTRPCRGRLAFTRAFAVRKRPHGRLARRLRTFAGSSGAFAIDPGHQAVVAVRLLPSVRDLLRAHRRLRVTASVEADPLSGGSGFGHAVELLLDGP
jgi:DNA-binding beta-propeller fold protein YncE